MNILYLAHRIPYPPNKGDKLRSFHQLRRLAERHRVWCACFVDDAADEQHVDTLAGYCQGLAAIRIDRKRATLRGLWGLARGGTLTESYYYNKEMRATLGRWALEVGFDAVVAFSSGMAPYALQVPARTRVLDLCDLDSQKWLHYAAASSSIKRRAYATEGRRLAAREIEWLKAFDATILITEAEASVFRQSARGSATDFNIGVLDKLFVVGNGVTLPEATDITTPPPNSVTSVNALNILETSPTEIPIVGFVGVMNYRPNIDAVCWFVDKCWPAIRAARPEAVFRIVGRAPTRRVRRLARVPGVHVVGEVDHPLAEIRRCWVSVAPMQIARGTQNKVLEAMAAAKPVVLSEDAARGINASDHHEFIVARSPGETAGAVVGLLNDQASRERIGSAARRFVELNHRWDVELERFELIVAGRIGPVSTRVGSPRAAVEVPAEQTTFVPVT